MFLKKQASCVPPVCTESDLVRFTPPGLGYVGIVQTFDALRSTTYKVGLHLHAPAGTTPNTLSIQVWYNGSLRGTYTIVGPNTTPYLPVSVWEFTTDSSGRGTLEVRVLRSTPYGNFIYLDNVTVTKKEPALG